MSKLPTPLRLEGQINPVSRYGHAIPAYDKPLYIKESLYGIVLFRHPSCPKEDRWRYVNRGNQGKPCFGTSWFTSAGFFENGFAVVSTETEKGLPRYFHINIMGKPAYRWRFIDVSDVNDAGYASVLHPKNPDRWLKLDFSNLLFLPPIDE